MKLKSTKNLLMITLSVLSITACKKDSAEPIFDESIAAEVQVTDDISMDLFDQINIASNTQAVLTGQTAGTKAVETTIPTSCGNVSFLPEGNAFPKTVTIDFGSGCTNDKGITHKGKITAVYSKPWYQLGATVTITLDKFFIDSIQIDGVKKFTNNGMNIQAGTFSYTVNVNNAKLTNHGTATWSSERTITFNTVDFSVSANGWIKGTTKKGVEYEANTTKDLVKEVLCRYLSEGTIEIKANGKVATVDYGKGDCDNNATLTINGHSKEIKIRR